jgi:hypothetical protein
MQQKMPWWKRVQVSFLEKWIFPKITSFFEIGYLWCLGAKGERGVDALLLRLEFV